MEKVKGMHYLDRLRIIYELLGVYYELAFGCQRPQKFENLIYWLNQFYKIDNGDQLLKDLKLFTVLLERALKGNPPLKSFEGANADVIVREDITPF